MATAAAAEEAAGTLEWEHGDEELSTPLLQSVLLRAFWEAFRRAGAADTDVASLLENGWRGLEEVNGGVGRWRDGTAELPRGVWEQLMGALGYRRTLYRDNSTRARMHRWLREELSRT